MKSKQESNSGHTKQVTESVVQGDQLATAWQISC
jgi:hypothetical protein